MLANSTCILCPTSLLSEDPLLNGEFAAAFVQGIQGNDPKYLQAAATLKHFAVYSQEANRRSLSVEATSQDMEDTYLPAFSVGIEVGKAEGLMCSYNAETYGNGLHNHSMPVPSCANRYLMNVLARGKWGFDG